MNKLIDKLDNLPRYDIEEESEEDGNGGIYNFFLVTENDEGEFVKWEDIEKLINETK
jgi:hypothetical protein